MQPVVREHIQREQDEISLALAEANEVPVAIFELIDRQPSGFVREGTEKLPEPVELDVAGFRQIMINSAYRTSVKDKRTGKTMKARKPIRYRASSESIDPVEQDNDGAPANLENDRIVFKNGRIIVVREGLTIGMYDYLKKDSRNESNPDRIPSVPALYREVVPQKEDEQDNEYDLQFGRAMQFIDKLITKDDGEEKEYDEQRLEVYGALFNVRSDNPAGIIKGLIGTAKVDPKGFVSKAKHLQEKLFIDIEHAERLGLLLFEKTRVIYPSKNKMLLAYSERVKNPKDYLATYFMSEKGGYAYQEFLIELQAAKEKNIGGPAGGGQGKENDPNLTGSGTTGDTK